MKLKSIVIGSLMLISQGSLANDETNPFLKPSERVAVEEISLDELALDNCEDKSEEGLADMLAEEIKENLPPEFNPDVLGEWTRADVENSRYIGESNGHRVYFHTEKQVYFTLDLSRANKSNDE